MYNYTFFYGSALVRLVHNSKTYGIKLYSGNNCFLVNEKSLIYLKHSHNRISPWAFTFTSDNLNEIAKLCEIYKELFVVLICNDDGICCLDFNELSQVIFFGTIDHLKSIRISRSPREKYTVSGSDGRIKHKIGDNEFPEKILID